ncbi:MAG: hypothetical protein RL375_3875 [Pseudomonadota bacterium]
MAGWRRLSGPRQPSSMSSTSVKRIHADERRCQALRALVDVSLQRHDTGRGGIRGNDLTEGQVGKQASFTH